MSTSTIRHPTPDEDLGKICEGLQGVAVNPEQAWVVDVDGQAVATCLVWDAGHGVAYVGYLEILPSYQHEGYAPMLLEHVRQDLISKGRTRIVAYTSSLRVAYYLEQAGLCVSTPLFLVEVVA